MTTTEVIKLASCRSWLSRSLREAAIDFRSIIPVQHCHLVLFPGSPAQSGSSELLFPGVSSTSIANHRTSSRESSPPHSQTMAAVTGEFSEVEHKGVAILYFIFGK